MGDRLEAAHVRHQQVQHDGVGLRLAAHLHGLFTVLGFADDLVADALELQPQQKTDIGLVIDHDDPQGAFAHAAGSSRRATMPPSSPARTRSSPPSARASVRASARPRPRPGVVVTARSPRKNASTASCTSAAPMVGPPLATSTAAVPFTCSPVIVIGGTP